MRPGRPFLLFLLVPLLLSACAGRPTLPSVTPPAEEVFQQVSARREALHGLKGLAYVKLSSPEKSLSGQQVLFARLPGDLRVETLSPLGTPLLYIVTDGKEIRLYVPEENRYYQGAFEPRALSFAFPLALYPEEMVAFLLGGVPRMEPEKLSLRPDAKEGLWVLGLDSPSRGESQILWVHPESFHILRAELHRPGLSLHLTYSSFRELKGVLFPHQRRLISEDRKTRISAEFPEVDLNPEWGVQDFSLPVPRGATVLPLP
jgi:outer membrane lipoprotein-sorting protein